MIREDHGHAGACADKARSIDDGAGRCNGDSGWVWIIGRHPSPRREHSRPVPDFFGCPQWVASDALSPALVEAIDLAAMNEAAGIWLGPATKDQYGPYRPLRLPTGHKLLHAKPTDPDKDALATRPMRDWRHQLSIIAPLFVREVLDPPELWVHNRKRQAAWTNRMWEVLSPGGKKDPSGYFGRESFMNSDGKLAQRV